MRSLPRAAAAGAVVAGFAVALAPAYALMMAMKTPAQRAVSAEVVVAGKIASVAKEDVEAVAPYAGATNKVKYRVATVTIETGLAGADKMKEIKVGFALPPKPDPNAKGPGGLRPPRGPLAAIEPKEGQEMLFFLAKHPSADFYVIPPVSPPVDLKTEQGKKDLEAVKKVTAALADPMKGLKSDKAEARAETATLLVLKYRAFPELGGDTEQAAIDADESKLILKALPEGDWSQNALRPGPGASPNALTAFFALGLNEKDKWVQPVVVPSPPGTPPPDYGLIMKDAFTKWREGPGKDYVVKKFVPKKK